MITRDEYKIASKARAFLVLFLLILLSITYAAIYLPFIPTKDGYLGGDYSFIMPNLLAGHYWYLKNGWFEIPWFLPSFCGGFPFYADLSVPWFSLPQLITFYQGPLAAIQISFVSYAIFGFAGMYSLLRLGYRCSRSASALAATLFMFNGFYSGRMIVGHMTFQAVMLTPLVATAIICAAKKPLHISKFIFLVALVAFSFALMAEGGAAQLLPIVITSILILVGVYFSRGRAFSYAPIIVFALGGVIALVMTGPKISGISLLLKSFPRDYYLLPGLSSFKDIFINFLNALFFSISTEDLNRLSNFTFLLGEHEWSHTLSPIPFILIFVGLLIAIAHYYRNSKSKLKISYEKIIVYGLTLTLMTLPVLLNYYEPNWNETLKNLPVIGRSSNFVRWLLIYVMVIPVISGIYFDNLIIFFKIEAGYRSIISFFLIVSAVIWFGFHIPNFFYDKSYKGIYVENAWSTAVSPSSVLPINHVGAFTTPEGKIQMPVNRNDALIVGGSQLACYQAIMGYRLEKFPIGSLVLGPAMQSAEGRFNFKNPSCYLFPAENNCFPGDHFQTSQSSELIKFLSYEKFNYSKPSWFEWLSTFSLVAWIFVGLTFTLAIGKYLYSKQSRFSRTK